MVCVRPVAGLWQACHAKTCGALETVMLVLRCVELENVLQRFVLEVMYNGQRNDLAKLACKEIKRTSFILGAGTVSQHQT